MYICMNAAVTIALLLLRDLYQVNKVITFMQNIDDLQKWIEYKNWELELRQNNRNKSSTYNTIAYIYVNDQYSA